MKKLFFILGMISSFSSFSQEHNLAERISSNPNFINLNSLFSDVLKMPKANDFIESFDKERLQEEGNAYLSDVSGINPEDIAAINEKICYHTEQLISDFPELKELSIEEINRLMQEATDMHYGDNPDVFVINTKFSNFKTCADCKREGRAQMVAGVVLGGLSGLSVPSPWRLLGVWGGAVIGFWAAAENTLSCFKEYCK